MSILGKVLDVAEYELVSSSKSLVRTDTLMYLSSGIALIFAITKKTIPLVLILFVLIILQGKRDLESGNVIAYHRDKAINQSKETMEVEDVEILCAKEE